MKKLFLSILFLFSVGLVFASNSKVTKAQKKYNTKFSSGCGCSTLFNYEGYTFTFSVAFYTSDGSCNPCSATDSYGAVQGPSGSIISEGVPSAYGLGIACGSSMQCITKIITNATKHITQI